MREIKFRAWDKEKRRMFEPTFRAYAGELEELYISLNGRLGLRRFDAYYDQSTFPERFEVMQYTGLKDAKGIEIYEGDIVKIDDYFNGEMNAKVVFEKGSFGFVGIDRRVIDVVNSNWNDDFLSASYLSWTYDHPGNELLNAIVIGNIYENPELLEREAE